MLLPNYQNAFVSEEKVEQYLLNPSHVEGSSKATFFINCGFNQNNTDEFINALIKLVETNLVVEVKPNDFGTKYIVYGKLLSPSGRSPEITTIWIIENHSEIPKLVTAYPKH